MEVLREWLGGVTVDAFRTSWLQRTPVAQPGSASSAREFDWEHLEQVLSSCPVSDALVVAKGCRLDLPVPRTLSELYAYFQMGIGLVLRHTEHRDPVLARVHADLERELGPAHVQLFVTPGGTHGFGWHYDDEDVFIAQTAGVKEYYFRANTVTTERADAAQFHRYTDETSTLCTATLVPGDFLYIPARWWHMAVCREDALSISAGVYPR
jgi:50S ribosomal protein L16 3-hydroxylase